MLSLVISAYILSLSRADVPEWFESRVVHEGTRSVFDSRPLQDYLSGDVSCTLPPQCATCPLKFEIVQVQDRTGSFSGVIRDLRHKVGDFMADVETLWPLSQYGLATFADKPVPYLGTGDYSDIPWWYARDVCYKRIVGLESDVDIFKTALKNIIVSGGGDWPENPLGAVMSAAYDDAMGWSKGRRTEDGTPVVRLLVLVTDSIAHAKGDLEAAMKKWNSRLGTQEMEDQDKGLLRYGSCNVDGPIWAEFKSLRRSFDLGELTPAMEARFNELADICGPFFDVSKVTPHPFLPFDDPKPVEDDLTNCMVWEYPSFQETLVAIRSVMNLIPIVVTVGPNAGLEVAKYYSGCGSASNEAQCLRKYYQKGFGDYEGYYFGLQGGVTGDRLLNVLKFAVTDVASMYRMYGCDKPCQSTTELPSLRPPLPTLSSSATRATTSIMTTNPITTLVYGPSDWTTTTLTSTTPSVDRL
ncbi:MAG: hypothetical protein KVP17_000263 [Porospora cf. gigantea B]|uniref:uncharacterized protein n=1 Tax=Porospora cf. gigantea B TaxID=2853592 RepID=UPI003571E329|nr:MAG: hypothetical protein KVP17_000263 [Porospora cf. gigantea B]